MCFCWGPVLTFQDRNRSSFETFTHYRFEDQTHQVALRVIREGGDHRLTTVRNRSFLCLTLARIEEESSTDRIRTFLEERIAAGRGEGRVCRWLDPDNPRLRHQYARFSRLCPEFQNPLKDEIRLSIHLPYVDEGCTLSHPKISYNCSAVTGSIGYDTLDTVADLAERVMDAVGTVQTTSHGAAIELPLNCFTLSKRTEERLADLRLDANQDRPVSEWMEERFSGKISIRATGFNVKRLKEYLSRLGTTEGYERGYRAGRDKSGDSSLKLDEAEHLHRYFGLDTYKTAYEDGYSRGYRTARQEVEGRVKEMIGTTRSTDSESGKKRGSGRRRRRKRHGID